VFFPRANSPNHHALADRFGLYDRFFVNAEVSPDGHNWSMAGYATDYLEKTVPSNYSDRGRSYDYEGTNRNRVPSEEGAEDAAEPANGYLWDLVQRKGLTFRNYGEFVIPERADPNANMPAGYRGVKPFLAANTNREFPSFDMAITDQRRADIWLAEFRQYVQRGAMPALMIVRLPNDHTSGARAGMPTPHAYMADNDLALGRIVEAVSKSPFWKNTLIVALEDDRAERDPTTSIHIVGAADHLRVLARRHRCTDSRTRPTCWRRSSTCLGLDALSQFDHYWSTAARGLDEGARPAPRTRHSCRQCRSTRRTRRAGAAHGSRRDWTSSSRMSADEARVQCDPVARDQGRQRSVPRHEPHVGPRVETRLVVDRHDDATARPSFMTPR
jgi:hypothetical protein